MTAIGVRGVYSLRTGFCQATWMSSIANGLEWNQVNTGIVIAQMEFALNRQLMRYEHIGHLFAPPLALELLNGAAGLLQIICAATAV